MTHMVRSTVTSNRTLAERLFFFPSFYFFKTFFFFLIEYLLFEPHRFVCLCEQQIRFQCELCTPILFFNYLDFSRFKMKWFWRSTWQHTHAHTTIAASTWHLHQRKKKKQTKRFTENQLAITTTLQFKWLKPSFFVYSFYLPMWNFFAWLCLPKIKINNQTFFKSPIKMYQIKIPTEKEKKNIKI